MGNKKMMSFRINPHRKSDLEYLCATFDCSEATLIENLLGYAVQQMEWTKEMHVPADIVKELAFDSFGYEWREKIIDLYE